MKIVMLFTCIWISLQPVHSVEAQESPVIQNLTPSQSGLAIRRTRASATTQIQIISKSRVSIWDFWSSLPMEQTQTT